MIQQLQNINLQNILSFLIQARIKIILKSLQSFLLIEVSLKY